MANDQIQSDGGEPGPIRDPYFRSPEGFARRGAPEPTPTLTIDPFVGHRIWSLVPGTVVDDRPEHPVLRSTNRGLLWEGPDLAAVCLPRRGGPSRHPAAEVPALGCSCGLYALKQPAPPPRPWTWALGTVALSGKVLEGTLGYRASRARIEGPLRLSLGGNRPRCLAPLCRRPANWIRITARLYLPRCPDHLQPEVNGMINLPLDEFLPIAARTFARRYGVGLEGA